MTKWFSCRSCSLFLQDLTKAFDETWTKGEDERQEEEEDEAEENKIDDDDDKVGEPSTEKPVEDTQNHVNK